MDHRDDTLRGSGSTLLRMVREVDSLCLEFEQAWNGKQRPRIETYLGRVADDIRLVTIRRLVAQEIELRRAAGETVDPQEYHRRFPEHPDVIDAALVPLGNRQPRSLAPEETESLLAQDPFETSESPTQPLSGPISVPEHIGRFVIQRQLGKGTFGFVYLALDPELSRLVAVKVPVADRFTGPEALERFIDEARTVAQLDCPRIVRIYDVGHDAGQVFIVQEYLQGGDLGKYLKSRSLTHRQAVEMMIAIAEGVAFAHQRGFVHRDLKPGNILLDDKGQPHVADFGLAVHESIQHRRKGERSGTPAYMSPEQARGETHRLDGRSDIWSLGVIFYRMLTGRPPFAGENTQELFSEVKYREPWPPRQINPKLPAELERICLKCLSKRVTDRYSNASDLADDLRHWLSSGREQTSSEKEPDKAKIVPKGLRSFGAEDADFFLDLLPGPRDRAGLPESIRFWKTRIEEIFAENTFTVGLMYGPSGCGKSSFVKAGLLPRVASHVTAVYLESTPVGTEGRLLNALRRYFPQIPSAMPLPDLLQGLREGLWAPAGQKILIVLDQFEQWLHAKRGEQDCELLQSLRHCDGGRLQCLILVRDDFWLATSRFMRALEIGLVDGENQALVDLFDLSHARKVLGEFGRALGQLSDDLADLNRDQEAFLRRAVEGLAEHGKVICVRLALFAEMMKSKPWTTAALKQVGGIEGLGETFLEETFSAATAPAAHRYHQKAAQAVLKALLPQTGSSIKGGKRSHQELLAASGYARRVKDFQQLIHILDNETRLITPSDPQGVEADEPSQPSAEDGQMYYQLAHDYLVPSLREWLARKQVETRRGRAALRLAERSQFWNAKPEARQLPSFWEWIRVCLFIPGKDWSPPQRRMMKAARWHHLKYVVMVTVVLTVLGVVGYQAYGHLNAVNLVARLLESETVEVPAIVEQMVPFRRWVDPLLDQATADNDPRRQLHISLAKLPQREEEVDYLGERMLDGRPDEVRVIRSALLARQNRLALELRGVLEDGGELAGRRFRAACALALFEPHGECWTAHGEDVAAWLVAENPVVIKEWADLLSPVQPVLLDPLKRHFRSGRPELRFTAAVVLAMYLEDNVQQLVRLNRDSNEAQRRVLADTLCHHEQRALELLNRELARTEEPLATDDAKAALAREKSCAATMLMLLGDAPSVWPALAERSDPYLRTCLIHGIAPAGVDPDVLLQRLSTESNPTSRMALLLSLGQYEDNVLNQRHRGVLVPELLRCFATDPDPGVHGACEWLLRRLGHADKIAEGEQGLRGQGPDTRRQWYVTRQGLTFAIVRGPVSFDMGSPPGEEGRGKDELRHQQSIPRTFVISTKEVTLRQFRAFWNDYQGDAHNESELENPVGAIDYGRAAAYCQWLSEAEGIPPGEWCYEHDADEVLQPRPDCLARTGYRLPTEAEWEYCCRAGTSSPRFYGCGAAALASYGWYQGNASGSTHPVGLLMPNSLGLFDMYGNVAEWCEDQYEPERKEEPDSELSQLFRVVRGGAFSSDHFRLRSAARMGVHVNSPLGGFGFRPARTLHYLPEFQEGDTK